MSLLHDVVEVRVAGPHRLWIRFDDGTAGEIDIAKLIGDFRGVFAPLRDQEEFAKVQVQPEWGTIYWPSGADIDPVVLYCAVTGQPVPGEPLPGVVRED